MTINNMDYDGDVTYEIREHIGTISVFGTGWTKELNLVSWNGGVAKYDIRDWSPDHRSMSRGITLYEKEMRLIIDLLRKRRQNSRRNFFEELQEEVPQELSEEITEETGTESE